MKKVLLATTILGMTAGFAAAEIAFTGTATAGLASQAGGATAPYGSFKLGVAASAESDSGISFGASTSFTSGTTYTFADDETFAVEDGTMGNPSVFLSGDFGKITVKVDGFKEYQDDSNEVYDVEYAHTFGGVSVGVRTDVDGGDSSIKLGYTVGAVALSGAYDQLGDLWGVSAAYTMNALTFTIATADDEVTSLKVAYKADGVSGSIKAATDDSWDLEAGYTANGITVGAKTNEADEWTVTGAYDLGGGLTAEAGVNYTDDMYVGAKMSF